MSHTPTCPLINASDIDKEQELTFPNGKVKETNKAVHDTIAVDLFIVVKDRYGRNVEGALVEIISVESGKTDKNGQASFVAFYNGSGKFKVKISHKDYGCFEIDELNFGSGVIRWLEITFIK